MAYNRQQFTEKFFPYAEKAAMGSGIFPETIMTVAIVESNNGNSQLAVEANNYFGIKKAGTPSWTGDTITLPTKEYKSDGSSYTTTATFRKYPSPEAGFKGYIDFLKGNPRYEKAGVFSAASIQEQFERLKTAGYATDPNYAALLTGVYDKMKSFMTKAVSVVANTAINVSNRVIRYSKKNPKTAIATSIGIVGALGIFYFAMKKKKTSVS